MTSSGPVATILIIFLKINLTQRKPDVVDLFSYFRGPFFLYAVNGPYFLVHRRYFRGPFSDCAWTFFP